MSIRKNESNYRISLQTAELLKEISLFVTYVRAKQTEQRRDGEGIHVRRWISTDMSSTNLNDLFMTFTVSTTWTLIKDLILLDLISSGNGIAQGKSLYLSFDPVADTLKLLTEVAQPRSQTLYCLSERLTSSQQQADIDMIENLCTSVKLEDYAGGDVSLDTIAVPAERLLTLLEILSNDCCFRRRPVVFRKQGDGTLVAPWIVLAPRFTAGQFIAAALEVQLWAMWDEHNNNISNNGSKSGDSSSYIGSNSSSSSVLVASNPTNPAAPQTSLTTASISKTKALHNCQDKLARGLSSCSSVPVGLMQTARAALMEVMRSTDVEKLTCILSTTQKRYAEPTLSMHPINTLYQHSITSS